MSEKWYPGGEDEEEQPPGGGAEDEQWFLPPAEGDQSIFSAEDHQDLFDQMMGNDSESEEGEDSEEEKSDEGIFSNLGETEEENGEEDGEEASEEGSEEPQEIPLEAAGNEADESEGGESEAEEGETSEIVEEELAEESPALPSEAEQETEEENVAEEPEPPVETSQDVIEEEPETPETEDESPETDAETEETPEDEVPQEEAPEEGPEEPDIEAADEAGATEEGEIETTEISDSETDAPEEEASSEDQAEEALQRLEEIEPSEETTAEELEEQAEQLMQDIPEETAEMAEPQNLEEATDAPGLPEEEVEVPLDEAKEGLPEEEAELPAETPEEEPETPETEDESPETDAETEETPEDEVPQEEAPEEEEDLSDEAVEKMLKDEQVEREKELARIRQKLDAEFQNEASRQDKADAPRVETGKSVEDYMIDLDTLNMGLLVHYLSKRRDKKLGREIDETNKAVEELKADVREKAAMLAENEHSRAPLPQAETPGTEELEITPPEEYAPAEQTVAAKASEDRLQEQVEESKVQEVAGPPEVMLGEIPVGAKETMQPATGLEEDEPSRNQEFNGAEAHTTEIEEKSRTETLADENEIHRPQSEESFDRRQEKTNRPKNDSAASSSTDYSSQSAVPISDIIMNKKEEGGLEARNGKAGLSVDAPDHETVEKYKTPIRTGVMAGLTIAGLIILYLLLG